MTWQIGRPGGIIIIAAPDASSISKREYQQQQQPSAGRRAPSSHFAFCQPAARQLSGAASV
jgi:predicted SAM-dependent methyltransferase